MYIPVTWCGKSDPRHRPCGGSHPSQIANTSWKTTPSQKIGITQITIPHNRTPISIHELRFAPATTPVIMPTTEATTMEPIAISIVAGSLLPISSNTGLPR